MGVFKQNQIREAEEYAAICRAMCPTEDKARIIFAAKYPELLTLFDVNPQEVTN